MKKTVYECRSCSEPCRLVMLGDKSMFKGVCPAIGVSYAVWQKVSECEVLDEDKATEKKQ